MDLPGVGPYTAAAIASIVYGLDVPAVDGNVRRVLARVFDIATPVSTPDGTRIIMKLAEDNLPHGRAGDYNQALMDLGAVVCKPRNPDCFICPLIKLCQAYIKGNQDSRPVVASKTAVPHYTTASAVIEKNSQVIIRQRPENGLLGGMWEFPGGKTRSEENPFSCLQRQIYQEFGIGIKTAEQLGIYKHAYTHFRETRFAFLYKPSNGKMPQLNSHKNERWVTHDRLADYPMGKIDRQIAGNLISRQTK
jgi:A/G-specific adenine glycosylase